MAKNGSLMFTVQRQLESCDSTLTVINAETRATITFECEQTRDGHAHHLMEHMNDSDGRHFWVNWED